MRRTEEVRWTKTHTAPDPRRPVSNYGIQGVPEELLVTIVPRRGQSSALARRYKRRSDTFRTRLEVYMSVSTSVTISVQFVSQY